MPCLYVLVATEGETVAIKFGVSRYDAANNRRDEHASSAYNPFGKRLKFLIAGTFIFSDLRRARDAEETIKIAAKELLPHQLPRGWRSAETLHVASLKKAHPSCVPSGEWLFRNYGPTEDSPARGAVSEFYDFAILALSRSLMYGQDSTEGFGVRIALRRFIAARAFWNAGDGHRRYAVPPVPKEPCPDERSAEAIAS